MSFLLKEEFSMIKDKDGNLSTAFLDEEFDIVDVTFNNDGCATIDTSNYTYLVIDSDYLRKLADMVDDADAIYQREL